ncbi:MAG TPA: S8 family serine peptidase, partial [Jatrophihabitans sp.]
MAEIAPAVTPSASWGSGGEYGYSADLLQSAYGVTDFSGDGEIVAIVDAFDDPNAETFLNHYRTAQNNLGGCTTAGGCFTKINQQAGTSYPEYDPGWAGEIELDLAAVSAICPGCRILLVEADSASGSDLYAAVQQAVQQGAKFVSMSWGGGESPSATTADAAYFSAAKAPNVTFVASTGDCGFYDTAEDNIEYPAVSPDVVAAGGVTLSGAGPFSYTAWGHQHTDDHGDPVANASCWSLPWEGAG